ncbi:MAG: hypothetical protein ABIR60_06795 [Allosphingosinicella sp.]
MNIRRLVFAACASLFASACVTHSGGVAIIGERSYRLVSVDGRPVGDRAFTISFSRSGTYSARFDCADHFGRYSIGGRLVLEPGASALGVCDEVDLKTGRQIVARESFGDQFLDDQPFAVAGAAPAWR